MAIDDTGSELILTPLGDTPQLAPWSARGLTQSLDLITASAVRRTINGELRSIAQPQFRKFKSTIQCSDTEVPALDSAWEGVRVTVQCVAKLKRPDSAPAARTMVNEVSANGFTQGNPVLDMLILDIRTETDEWGATVGWSMDLEEV